MRKLNLKKSLIPLAGGVFFIFACVGMEPIDYSTIADRNFREDMHKFVTEISSHGKKRIPGFVIIPQNGHELLLDNKKSRYRDKYIDAIDGIGQEELFFGIPGMNDPVPTDSQNYLLTLLNTAKEADKKVLIIDYCTKKDLLDKSYFQNYLKGFISFGATRRELTNIPDYPEGPYNVNNKDITSLDKAQNFLYLINTEKFNTKQKFLGAINRTNYDLIVLDLFYQEEILTKKDVESIKQKQDGGRRRIIAYLSIGEAETYRYYWDNSWNWKPPVWLDKENPNWPGNYKVRFWEKEWKDLIIYNKNSYLNKIIDAGFDGVYLDIIDGYYYFEEVVKELES